MLPEKLKQNSELALKSVASVQSVLADENVTRDGLVRLHEALQERQFEVDQLLVELLMDADADGRVIKVAREAARVWAYLRGHVAARLNDQAQAA